MAYAANTLVLNASAAPGNAVYYHDAGSDTMATVIASGYFNNSDDDLNLTVDDLIFSQCTDGDIWHKVSALSSGSVTTQMVSGEGPYNGVKGTASISLSVGITELGTGTATAFALPTPYPGAKVTVMQMGTLARTVEVSTSGVTLNGQGNTTVLFTADEGETTTFLGVSLTRWALIQNSSDSVLS